MFPHLGFLREMLYGGSPTERSVALLIFIDCKSDLITKSNNNCVSVHERCNRSCYPRLREMLYRYNAIIDNY